jgi:hypothetical protein
MTSEQIEKFLTVKNITQQPLKIFFKTRSTLTGVFIRTNDFNELKEKNFWRIVSGENLAIWSKTQNNNLAKIFSGQEIVKLSEA